MSAARGGPGVSGAGPLSFWLDFVEAAGGLIERSPDRSLALLPGELAAALGVPEQLDVTAEPDLAREEGAVLMAPGHPALVAAAEQVLDAGDVAVAAIGAPRSRPLDRGELESLARQRLPVEHGRIDASGAPLRTQRPVLRVGGLAEYTTGADEHYFERLETWIDPGSGLPLPESVRNALMHAEWTPTDAPTPDLGRALSAAARDFQSQALARRAELARQSRAPMAAETARAADYYQAVLESLDRRRRNAAADRAAMLDSRAEAVRAERDRRLAEIGDKHEPKHSVRPYRCHLLWVPALRIEVDVRRGERRYPLVLDWLLPAREFAGVRCPTCGGVASLVAGKAALGCTDCVRGPAAPTPSPTSAKGRPATLGTASGGSPHRPPTSPAAGPATGVGAPARSPGGAEPAGASDGSEPGLFALDGAPDEPRERARQGRPAGPGAAGATRASAGGAPAAGQPAPGAAGATRASDGKTPAAGRPAPGAGGRGAGARGAGAQGSGAGGAGAGGAGAGAPDGARPAAPAATVRRPAQPVRMSGRRIVEVGDRLALKFWRTVADGEPRKLARLCEPDSPAAAAVRLFGAAGPLWMVGAHAGFVPESLVSSTDPDPNDALQVTVGTLSGHRQEYRFALVWAMQARDHLVGEIQRGGWWFLRRQVPDLRPPALRCEVDPVTRLLIDSSDSPYLTVRAVASWWRVPDSDGALDRYGAVAVAAALHRAARYWSRRGETAPFAAVAERFGADPGAVRAASGALQRALRLTYDQPW